MSTAGSAGRDTRLFKVCDPWYGQKGAPFERVFRPAFTSGIASVVRDEYGNGRDHLKGSDPGGVKAPTAAQLAANAAHAGTISQHFGTANEVRKSVIAWRQRDTEVINALRTHIPVVSIQSMIDKMVKKSEEDAPDAVQIGTFTPAGVSIHPPVYSAGHPNAGAVLAGQDLTNYQKYGNSLARHIFGAVQSRGLQPATGAKKLSQQSQWTTLTMDVIGYTETSCEDLMQLMDTLDNESGGLHSNDDKRCKFLSIIISSNTCSEVKTRAGNELVHASAECQVAGVADYELTVGVIAELWAFYIGLGKFAKKEPIQRSNMVSNRVDGMHLDTMSMSFEDAYALRDTSFVPATRMRRPG